MMHKPALTLLTRPQPDKVSAARLKVQVQTLMVALLGALIWTSLALPLPWLLGPMMACFFAALCRMPLADLGHVGKGLRTIIGVAIGASLSPALLQSTVQFAGGLLLVPLFVLVAGWLGYLFLRHVHRYDAATAFYAAMPGGLQDILVLGQEAGASMRSLSLVHTTRLLVIVALVPMLASLVWGIHFHSVPAIAPTDIMQPWPVALLCIALGIVGWKLLSRWHITGAAVLGPLTVSGALHCSGVVQGHLPPEMLMAAQMAMGITIGSKFAGIRIRELFYDVMAGFMLCVLFGGVAAFFAWVSLALGFAASPLEAFLSFAPGGHGEMAMIGLMAGANLAFVATHHIARMLLVVGLAPVIDHKLGIRRRVELSLIEGGASKRQAVRRIRVQLRTQPDRARRVA